MLKRLKLKQNEKGLTLIELLVVIVILGIIAAIAILAIGNIIDNSKKDAHIANAKQVADATRLYMSSENKPAGTFKLSDLEDAGYLENIEDPSGTKGASYDKTNSTVTVDDTKKPYTYTVTLKGAGGTTYIDAKPVTGLGRDGVTLKGTGK